MSRNHFRHSLRSRVTPLGLSVIGTCALVGVALTTPRSQAQLPPGGITTLAPAPEPMVSNRLHQTFERLVDEVQGIRLALEAPCGPQPGPAVRESAR